MTYRHASVALALLLLVGASACGGEGSPRREAGKQAADAAGEQANARPEVPEEDPKSFTLLDIDVSNFDSNSANVDNKYLPLTPGTRLIYEGSTQEGDERIPRRVVTTVTDLTKVVHGVRTAVAWEQDYSDGELIESELFFVAQDKAGNVWHLGQVNETYDDEGEYVGTRAWLAGLEEFKAGIFMPADPQAGTPSYSMGHAKPPYSWDDRGRVDAVGQRTCVRAGCYEDVVVIDEFEPDHPGAHQLKYHAPGVGVVKVSYRGSDAEKETLELVQVEQLSPEGVAEARAAATVIEHRANLYARTPPLEPRPAV